MARLYSFFDRSSQKPKINRIFPLFKTESYSLVKNLREQVLRDLEVPPTSIFIDVFENHKNHQEALYLTRDNSAWRYNWGRLLRSGKECLCANPPFSQLSRVVTKLCLEPTRMVLVHPDWQDQYWAPLLRSISVARVEIPSGTPVFESDRSHNPLPAPPWNTHVSIVDTFVKKVPFEQLDPQIVKFLRKTSKNWTFDDLIREQRKYPKFQFETVEVES